MQRNTAKERVPFILLILFIKKQNENLRFKVHSSIYGMTRSNYIQTHLVYRIKFPKYTKILRLCKNVNPS